jgi:hypothetical protein
MIIMMKAKWHHLKLTECLMGAAILPKPSHQFFLYHAIKEYRTG